MSEAPTEIDKLHKRIWKLEQEIQKLNEDKVKLEQENERLIGLMVSAEWHITTARSWFDDARKELAKR